MIDTHCLLEINHGISFVVCVSGKIVMSESNIWDTKLIIISITNIFPHSLPVPITAVSHLWSSHLHGSTVFPTRNLILSNTHYVLKCGTFVSSSSHSEFLTLWFHVFHACIFVTYTGQVYLCFWRPAVSLPQRFMLKRNRISRMDGLQLLDRIQEVEDHQELGAKEFQLIVLKVRTIRCIDKHM